MKPDPRGGQPGSRAGDGAGLVEEYERLLDRLAVLAQSFGGARDLVSIFRLLGDFAEASTACNSIFISLYDPDREVRIPAYARSEGEETDVDALPSMPMSGSPHSRAVTTGQVVIEDDFQAAVVGMPIVNIAMDKDPRIVRSSLCVPMAVMGRVIGAVEVQSPNLAAFTMEHATAVRMAANLAAVSIENVRLAEREREREQQMRQSQRMEAVGRLAGGVAHDFNNLLTVITGYSDMALRRMGAGDAARRDVEEIRRAAERAATLTRQLLAFGRRQVLQPCVIDLNATVEEMSRMLVRLLGEDVHLVVSPQPDLGRVKVDKGQLEQVIVNLAVNARDAMPDGGWLRIETLDVELGDRDLLGRSDVGPGLFVMLAMSDTGHGMDEDTLAHIFEPFFTTKAAGKGTGLGLATVYGIIRQSGGLIDVESRVGRGSSFRIYLPRVAGDAPTIAGVRGVDGPERGTETVLLVEDEEAVRDLAARTLRQNGYRVLEAADGIEALVVAGRHPEEIHLLVTDVVMPRLGGPQLAEQLGGLRPRMRVLFVSGYPGEEAPAARLSGEWTAFLPKPFTPTSLARAVRDVLDRP